MTQLVSSTAWLADHFSGLRLSDSDERISQSENRICLEEKRRQEQEVMLLKEQEEEARRQVVVQEAGARKRLRQLLEEMVSTERSYVEDLDSVSLQRSNYLN